MRRDSWLNPYGADAASTLASSLGKRLSTLLLLLATSTALGIATGVLTNLVNRSISQSYFIQVMRWDPGIYDVPRLILVQGAIEGGCLGTIFGIVFSLASALSTGLRVPFIWLIQTLLGSLSVVLCCWVTGGVAGTLFLVFAPDLYHQLFFPSANSYARMLALAWVGGSIWGAYVGTVLATIMGSISIHRRLHRYLQQSSIAPSFAPLVQMESPNVYR